MEILPDLDASVCHSALVGMTTFKDIVTYQFALCNWLYISER